MNNLTVLEYKSERVLTTQQLAEAYGTSTDTITKNFNRNKDKYVEGKHYIALEGEEKNDFVDRGQFDRGLKNAKTLYLWTEKGTFLHAKSLNTDVAWEVYDRLIDHYFRTKQQTPKVPQTYLEALKELVAKEEENQKLLAYNSQLHKEIAVKEQVIGELKPKADYTDLILKSKATVTITQIAKDYGMSGQQMNKILHDLGVQYKESGQWLLYKKYQDKGYTHSETIDITLSDGRPDIRMNTKWLQKGRLFLYNLLKENGYLPMIEQGLAS